MHGPLEHAALALGSARRTLHFAKVRYKVRCIAINRCSQPMPSATDDIIKTLAHPLRRQILHWLKNPERHFADQEHSLEIGVCAGMIDRRAGLSQSTVSAHLATLQRAGLVSSRRVGQWHFFKRNEPAIQAFLRQLDAEL